MERRQRSKAELAILFRNVPTPKRVRPEAKVTVGKIPSSVAGGFKQGKRRRGNSLLKRSPVTITRVQGFDIIDAEGFTVASDVRLVTYSRKPA